MSVQMAFFACGGLLVVSGLMLVAALGKLICLWLE